MVSLWEPYFRKHWDMVPQWASKYKVSISSAAENNIATDATGLSLDVDSDLDSDSDSMSVMLVDVQ